MRMVQAKGLYLCHVDPGRGCAEPALVLGHAGNLAGPAATANLLADQDAVSYRAWHQTLTTSMATSSPLTETSR